MNCVPFVFLGRVNVALLVEEELMCDRRWLGFKDLIGFWTRLGTGLYPVH